MSEESMKFLAAIHDAPGIDLSTPERMTVARQFRELAGYIVSGIPHSPDRDRALYALSVAKSHALKPPEGKL